MQASLKKIIVLKHLLLRCGQVLLIICYIQLLLGIPFYFLVGEKLLTLKKLSIEMIVFSGVAQLLAIIFLLRKYSLFTLLKVRWQKEKRVALRYSVAGLLTGCLLPVLTTSIIQLVAEMPFQRSNEKVWQLLIYTIPFLVFAFTEELLCRFILLEQLQMSRYPIAAMLLSSLTFSLLHLFNPALTFLAIVNLFLFGIFMACLYYTYKSLLLITIIHAGWNFVSGCIIGSPVSGIEVPGLVKYMADKNNPLITGGSFGLEGSIITSLLLLLLILLLMTSRSKQKRPMQKDGIKQIILAK